MLMGFVLRPCSPISRNPWPQASSRDSYGNSPPSIYGLHGLWLPFFMLFGEKTK